MEKIKKNIKTKCKRSIGRAQKEAVLRGRPLLHKKKVLLFSGPRLPRGDGEMG